MMSRTMWLLLAVVTLTTAVGTGGAALSARADGPAQAEQYEYWTYIALPRTTGANFNEAILNKAGAGGWRLTAVAPLSASTAAVMLKAPMPERPDVPWPPSDFNGAQAFYFVRPKARVSAPPPPPAP